MMTLRAWVAAARLNVSYASSYLIEFEPMRDQPSRVDFPGVNGLEQHRRGNGIDKPRCDRDVLRSKASPDGDRP